MFSPQHIHNKEARVLTKKMRLIRKGVWITDVYSTIYIRTYELWSLRQGLGSVCFAGRRSYMRIRERPQSIRIQCRECDEDINLKWHLLDDLIHCQLANRIEIDKLKTYHKKKYVCLYPQYSTGRRPSKWVIVYLRLFTYCDVFAY